MKLFLGLLLLCTTPAFAYGDHQGWSSYRGGYRESYQFTNGVQAVQSTLTVDDAEGNSIETKYRGLGLKSSIGVELAKFVRFSAYHIYSDTSANLSNSLRGDDLGGDVKASFYGPVVNVNFGLGLFGSSLVNQTSESSLRYYGQGYVGSVGIERFMSQTTSFIFEVSGATQKLKAEVSAVKVRPEVHTLGVSLNLALWLN